MGTAYSPATDHRQRQSERVAEWVLFQLQVPGQELRPAGVLLVNGKTDQLHLSIRELLADEVEEDLLEIWGELVEDLRLKAQEMGGSQLLDWLENDSSHIFQVSARRTINALGDLSTTVEELFRLYVLADQRIAKKRRFYRDRTFSLDQIQKARQQVGPLPSAIVQTLSLFDDPNLDYRRAEGAISRDPLLTAHLLRAANVAAFKDPARTLLSALQRLGMEAVKFQILALTIRKVFSSPAIRKIWDHSIATAQLTRQFSQGTTTPPGEAGLLGLVHDIGQVILFGLGDSYPIRLQELRSQGLTPVQAERALCGTSHAELGAHLLSSWSFPADLVEAVAAHHSPASSDEPLVSLLYLAEAYGENNEDVYSIGEHALAAYRIKGVTPAIARAKTGIDPDLAVLRFAA